MGMRFHIYSGIDLYCKQCQKIVRTTVENGEKIYPHRPDLADRVFLQCEVCKNYVSCDELRPTDSFRTWAKRHEKKTIPTAEFRRKRQEIHWLIDDLWKSGVFERDYIYRRLSKATGVNFHNSSLNDENVAEKAYQEAMKLRSEARALGYRPRRRESL